MFDIDFIKNSESLKEEIASGKWNGISREKVIKQFDALMSPQPYVFNLETTNACNMKCVMCPRTTKMIRPIQRFPKELYPKLLDQIIPHTEEKLRKFFDYLENKYGILENEFSEDSFYYHISSRCLTLHGFGEPILDPNIVEVVSLCTARGIPTYFSTVPANINLNKVRELMSAGLGVIKFSLDALNDERAKEIRGNKNNFSYAMENIRNVLEYKKKHPEISTKIVITIISLSATEEQKDAEKRFIELWQNEDVFYYIKTQNDRWLYENNNGSKRFETCTKEYCEYPWTSMTVMADGNIVPCSQDYDCELVMGNIREKSLSEIWNSDIYRKFREMHITGKFPGNHKCRKRCDQILVVDRLNGIPRTHRVI